jgi:chromosome segregation ATPase
MTITQTERQRGTGQLSPNGDSSHELAAELARLRERFVAYERLDQQLDEMVTGLTDLLRGATELRRRTNQDIATGIARCEDLIASDRAHHRDTLTSLLADLDTAQRRTSSLTTAIATLQTELAAITDRLPAPPAPWRVYTYPCPPDD